MAGAAYPEYSGSSFINATLFIYLLVIKILVVKNGSIMEVTLHYVQFAHLATITSREIVLRPVQLDILDTQKQEHVKVNYSNL